MIIPEGVLELKSTFGEGKRELFIDAYPSDTDYLSDR